MEQLEKNEPRIIPVAFKMNKTELAAMHELMEEKNWNQSAFIRVAIKREMERLAKEK